MTIRVFIVDDHELFRSGVRSELGRDLEIVGEAGTVEEAVPAIVELRPTLSCSTSTCPAVAGAR